MKKIMFNDKYGLTDAVLDGRKTMTRRTIPQGMIEKYYEWHDDVSAIGFANIGMPVHIQTLQEAMILKAKYEVGEVIAIAQSYNDVNSGGYPVDSRYDPFRTAYSDGSIKESNGGWNNKMFVYADLMPHHIEITNVRVERLQDCSDDDILKEGVFQISAPTYRHYNGIGYTFKGWTERGVECSSDTPKGAFKALINKTCGRGTFESNPYVFAYSFKLLD